MGDREEEVVFAYTGVIGPWGLFLFLALAVAVLWATDQWMAVLGAWPDEEEKGDERRLLRVLFAVLSTAAAVGAWYALAFVALPTGA